MKYYLDGDRVGLVKLSRREVTEQYVDWMNDAVVTRYLVSGAFPTDLADIERYVASANSPTRCTFAIYRKDKAEHIGNIKLDQIDWVSRHGNIGVMIGHRDAWGHGFGTEAVKLATDYAFDTLNLERLHLGVVAMNEQAARIYQRLGYTEEGHYERNQYIDGKYFDTVAMGITRARWLAHRQRVVLAVQARMSSTRLPGKVLNPLAGKPALVRQIERLRAVDRAHALVVATSTDSTDDPIADCCESHGIQCLRGSLHDVLARFQHVVEQTHADAIVRLTGDCPLIDPAIVDACIARYLDHVAHVEYASNVDERTFPDGLDVEVADAGRLREAFERATSAADREHVMPYVRRHARKISLTQAHDLSALRWTLDYPEDYDFCADVYDSLFSDERHFTADDVYRLLVRRPDWLRTAPDRPPTDAERQRLIATLEAHLHAESTGDTRRFTVRKKVS